MSLKILFFFVIIILFVFSIIFGIYGKYLIIIGWKNDWMVFLKVIVFIS